ncbi:MAG: serine/threonine protein kinase, partial [Elusimicrobia bacterium]|nr:serine/threonine protein kinase [Elusimicrobiota bacterium]
MAEDPLIGTVLGPCRLERLIGAGGMGRVYKARHLALDRDVAVKLVDRAASADKAAREAAFAEARAAAKLEDPRIVAVYEVGEDRGVGYIVMQWVDGESLESRVRREGPLSNERALAVARDMAGALAAAHAAGIVHRDVKPANVLLDARGGAKLTDFGLAAGAGRADAGGEFVGSFHFMPPEQGWGAPPDPRMDVYALGGTWYFALTGAAPFSGAPCDIVVAHREAPPPDVRRLRPEVTSRASALIRRLLDKDPARRPQDGAALTAELADPGLLLEVDASGSPLSLLAPAQPAAVPGEIAAEPPRERYAPLPPPPAAVAHKVTRIAWNDARDGRRLA